MRGGRFARAGAVGIRVHMLRAFAVSSLLSVVLYAGPAPGFDYVEHSFTTDAACDVAQRELAREAGGAISDERLAARYLALSLMCPATWDRPYCERGYKQLEGSVNLLEEPPAQSGDHAITLGDFSALPDHLASWGAVRGVPQAASEGLTTRTLRWLARTGDAGGVVSDVAEDGCETRVPLRWDLLYAEMREQSSAQAVGTGEQRLSPLARAPVRKVVSDPAGAYSFDNPQYLDLVLHNHGHFGAEAHGHWRGFHATARDLSEAACEEVLPEARRLYRSLA